MDIAYTTAPGVAWMNITAEIPAMFGDQGDRMPPAAGRNGLDLLVSLMWYMQMYYNPAAAVLGITCNIIAFIIIPLSDLNKLSLGHYTIAILVANTGYLINVLLLWINHMGIHIYRHGSMCHFTTFISYASCFLSVWYTVCFAVDGFIVIGFRYHADRMCQPSRARIVIFCLAAIATAVFLNISLTHGVIHIGPNYICTAVSQFQESLQVLKYIDMFANSLLPYVAIFYIVMHSTIAHLCHPAETRRPLKRTRHATESVQFPLGLYLLFITACLIIDMPSQAALIFFTMRDLFASKVSGQLEWDYSLQQVMINLQNIKYASMFFILLCSRHFRVGFTKVPEIIRTRRAANSNVKDNGFCEEIIADEPCTSLIASTRNATARV